ncbi:translocation/assembly module TamB domain-containing protein [Roseococcus pinisoli]|uniref:Translocation/assembly module TamB domain-containing protein n=1 Tax=Roseococcus pinisoli TaxID=2835040 RepID=A0ABS5QHU6_9PROT|nr:translocation/assembly module TamB domain-containing protein [Roseococcus pinisoli]MBS7813174.1 translocation/assembly module TamB domain-containing protein [Roseococcus pinisoli]
MRWLGLLLAILILIPVLLVGALLTPFGLNAAAGLAMRFVPGLELEGVSGPLPGQLAVRRLAMRDAQGAWIEVENARIELAWRELFDRRVRLTSVRAGRIALHRLPPSDPNAPPAEPTPIAIPSVPQLPVAIRIDALEAERIEIGEAVAGQAAALSLAGSLSLEAQRLQTALTATRLDRPGSVVVNAALQNAALTAHVEASEPPGGLVAALAGQPQAPFAARIDLEGPASGAEWRLVASLGETGAELGGRLSVAPDGAAAVTLDGTVRPGPFVPEAQRALADRITPSLSLRRAADNAITIERLTVALPAGRAELSGTLSAAQALAFRFRAEPARPETFAGLLPEGMGWTALTLDGEVGGTVTVPELDLRVAGTGLHGAGAADEMLGQTVMLNATVRGADRRVDATLQAERLRATVRGPAASPFDVAFNLEARDPPTTQGTVSAEGRLTGTAEAPHIEARVTTERLTASGRLLESFAVTARATLQEVIAEATGRLDGKPLNVALQAGRDDQRLRLTKLEGSYAGIAFNGHGEGGLPTGPFDGALRLEAPDLAPLGMGLAGRLTLDLQARAIPGATGMAAQGVELRLNGTGVGVGATRASAQVEMTGTLAALNFRLGVTAPAYGLDLAGHLGQEGALNVITLSRLEARAAQDALRLAAPARILVTETGELTLQPARLTSRRGGTLALNGQLAGGNVTARADISNVPLGPLSGGLVAGTVSGQVNATGPSAAPQVDANIRVAGLRSTDPSFASIPAAAIAATARMQGQAFRAQAQVNAGPSVQLNIEASQSQGLGPAAPFEATVRGRLDLGQLARPFLAGGADRFAGRAVLDLRASGTAAAPELAGTVVLSEGSYSNPIYGVRLDGLAARIAAQGQRLVISSFSARTAGGGTLAAQGWVEPMGEGLPAEIRLTANRARPVSGETGEATIDADITVRGPLTDGGSLAGRVTIQRAEIRIPEQFGGSVPSVGPVREIGPLPPGRRPPPAPRPATAAARPQLPMTLNLTIAAPRAVFVRGRGLEAELGGEITIGGTVAAPVPSGGLRMRRGTFDLIGRQLQFTRGNIGFDSGTFMPTLDFLATSRSRSHTINLTVTGTPTAPELKVTAEPELPQDDALARLLFDRETSKLSPFELAGIAQAVAQLAGVMPAGAGVLDRLRSAVGLDRLGVGSDGDNPRGAAVEAGRYVAPGVYVGVRQGTSGGTPGVGVQVELTPRLRLEGQTSTGPGGDRLGVTWEYEY